MSQYVLVIQATEQYIDLDLTHSNQKSPRESTPAIKPRRNCVPLPLLPYLRSAGHLARFYFFSPFTRFCLHNVLSSRNPILSQYFGYQSTSWIAFAMI